MINNRLSKKLADEILEKEWEKIRNLSNHQKFDKIEKFCKFSDILYAKVDKIEGLTVEIK